MGIQKPRVELLTAGIATVGEQGLSVDPGAVGTEKLEDRGNVVDQGEAAGDGIGLVELDGFGGLLAVEERGVHGTRGDGIDADSLGHQLLAQALGEVLDGRLGTLVAGVQGRICRQQRRDRVDDLAPLAYVSGRLLRDQKGRLAVDGKHPVVLALVDLAQGLLQHLAHRVDHNVQLPREVGQDRPEQLLHIAARRQVALVHLDLDFGVLRRKLLRK